MTRIAIIVAIGLLLIAGEGWLIWWMDKKALGCRCPNCLKRRYPYG